MKVLKIYKSHPAGCLVIVMGYRAILDVAVYVLSHPQIHFLDESVAPSEKWTLRGHALGSGVL